MRNQSNSARESIFEHASKLSSNIGVVFRLNRLDLLQGKPLKEIVFEEIFLPAINVLTDDLEKRYLHVVRFYSYSLKVITGNRFLISIFPY